MFEVWLDDIYWISAQNWSKYSIAKKNPFMWTVKSIYMVFWYIWKCSFWQPPIIEDKPPNSLWLNILPSLFTRYKKSPLPMLFKSKSLCLQSFELIVIWRKLANIFANGLQTQISDMFSMVLKHIIACKCTLTTETIIWVKSWRKQVYIGPFS